MKHSTQLADIIADAYISDKPEPGHACDKCGHITHDGIATLQHMMKCAKPAAAAIAMQRKHNQQQAALGACVILAPGDPAERDPALMAERIAAQKAIYLAEMEKRNTAAQTAQPNNDSTLKTYVSEYMNGKSRRFSCFSYAEAVQLAHAVSPAVADISEL